MEWEGQSPSHLFLNHVSEIERTSEKISRRELNLFTAKARLAIGLDGELSVRITSARELLELNRRFRGKNKPTDVLSFPALAGNGGDIAIAREIAASNGVALGHSLTTELKILILHGLLHLAGYDHESDDGEMTARESELREELGLPFGLIERTGMKLQVLRRLTSAQDDKTKNVTSAQKKMVTAQLKPRPFKAGSPVLGVALQKELERTGKRRGRRA